MSKPKGFLMVTMEPPPALEEEFNDWYDTEHVPERKAVAGFEAATRFVCVAGWPRYVAYYDLRDVGVMDEPGYQAISGTRFSPWSKRILTRVRGLYRAYGEQVYPGHALTGPMTQMLLLRFRSVARTNESRLVEQTRRVFEARPGVRQVRVVHNTADATSDYLALIEMALPLTGPAFDTKAFDKLEPHIDLVNAYVPYFARGTLPGVLAP